MIEIKPQGRPQELFLGTDADIAIYGGSAGGGKSFALLIDPLRHIANKDMRVTIFRRNLTHIKNQGGLWDESKKIYTMFGAKPNNSELYWTFPSGMQIKFAHLEHEDTVYEHQGSQIPHIGFDELTHFSEEQFFYMMSRNRGVSGTKNVIRATCNPEGGSWLHRLLNWWIGSDGYPIKSRSGVVRYFFRQDDEYVDGESVEALCNKYGEEVKHRIKSITFISATIEDNIILLRENPQYKASLESLPNSEKEKLLYGRWVANVHDRVVPEFVEHEQSIVVDELELPTHFNPIVAMDVGFRDMTALLFGYYDFAKAKIVIQGEVVMKQMRTDTLAKNISHKEIELWGEREVYGRYSDTNLIVINDLTQIHGIHFIPTDKDDKDASINQLRLAVQNGNILIHRSCINLIEQMRNGKWDEKKKHFLRSSELGHLDCIDAVLYFIRNIPFSLNPYPQGEVWDDSKHLTVAAIRKKDDVLKNKLNKLFGGIYGNK